ncbi:MAG TPA: ABC transporter permease [Thermoanaerobaculia bacterium]|jgi:putative ABC transport system permease protein|nr:ABC transporter permease [Thermoanaerobaculia bacterium]
METLLQDLRFALRTLARRPAFTAVAVLTLALGIGANTALFTVVDGVLLGRLPFREPERLVVAWCSNPELAHAAGLPDKLPIAPGMFYDWQRQGRSFASLAMFTSERTGLTGQGEPELLGAVAVSGEFFRVLGAAAQAGRTLLPGDDEQGKVTTAVLSHKLWQRRFGGDSRVIGRTVILDRQPVTVVGVMPPGFAFPRGAEMPSGFGFPAEPDVWIPLSLSPKERQDRDNHSFAGIGRLRPGVSFAAARAEMATISTRLELANALDKGWRARLLPLREQLVGDVRPALLILFGAVGVVLLIACVNVANLLLAQAASRQKEVAIRTALGAARGRMARQLLTESLALALAGGALGVLGAWWTLRAFAAWLPPSLVLPTGWTLNLPVLLFTLGLTLLAGVVAGLAPTLHTTRPDLAGTLRDGTRAGAGTAGGRRTRSGLVIAETALAVLLVVGAGLLVRSFLRLTAVDPGFRPHGVLALDLLLPESKYDSAARLTGFFDSVIERLRALPGVAAVGGVSSLPLRGDENIVFVFVEGRPLPEPGKEPLADRRSATPGYFPALGIPLLQGRLFDQRDAAKAPPVALIDEVMARAYWPGADPLGKRFNLRRPGQGEPSWITVIGVVRNVRHSGLRIDARPQFYLPLTQSPRSALSLVVRTKGDPKDLFGDVRRAVYATDPDQPIEKLATMEQVISQSVAGQRFNMVLLGAFAALALALAAVGIYGITSYSVAQRTREMGLRMALGAQASTVLWMVLKEAGALAAVGLAAGLALALGATRVMASLLFGVPATDPATFAAVALALGAVALAAAWLPGRRATRVDPMVALRAE